MEAKKCPHYGRRCHVLAECCKKWVGCRLCHDEQLGEQHQIDRFAIKQMRCDLCLTEQPCAQECSNCHETMAAYFCSVCNLFDDKGPEKKVFHCDQCGICRVGGREKYYNCVKCCGCYPHSLEAKHKCLEGSMHRECPICLDVTFDSLESVNVLPCGHVMHASCFKAYVKHHNIECPTCRTLMFSEDEINGEAEDEGEEGEENDEDDTEGEEDGEEEDGSDTDDDDSSSSEDEDEEGVAVQGVAGDDDDSDAEPNVVHDAERNVWPAAHRP
ncbi:hypothetical protein PF005_g11504 [Phytophthora fragariae]|uniref:RING finger and CHY zinc finger domain-containing protein 1 n=1 Tax=Phytophthora fragariae TaxID=53985 RepID=A0A6A3S9X2_9STRA|nr:hypothetical protein PF009_g12362 [Phytophthora fragariae]KAE9009883.1 hypothetical protein PF011_g10065 [Phytophthora fragariae]KAE9110776.1 hypothetical protein PF010_g11047 [Phytophthora fragariae]KAE9112256.1 hypothetical protein PF007_g11172 [Phytophthora fragariae]KAE9144285.1 hypothetical protein PF006_g10766 [Phytophthora fragariae]